MSFGQRLLQAIEISGLDQKQLSEKTGITAATISRYCTDKMGASGENIKIIAKILNVSTDYLLENDITNLEYNYRSQIFPIVLKSLRLDNNMTQKELAIKINSSKSKVGMWESGKRDPSSDDLILLSTIFDVTIDYLLGNSDTKNSKTKDNFITEKDIAKTIQKLKYQLANDKNLKFYGNSLDENIAKLLLESIEQQEKWIMTIIEKYTIKE